MAAGTAADLLCFTGGTEPAGVIGIARAAGFLIIGVFLYLLGNGSPVLSQFFADFAKGGISLQTPGNDQTVFIR